MCFLQWVNRGYGRLWRGVIIDTEYKPLEDIKNKTFELFSSTGGKFHRAKSDYYWEWPSGETFYLRAAKNIEEANRFLGHEYSFIAFNEITKWNTSEVFDHIQATMRTGKLRQMGVRPIIFCTTNPYGTGAVWVKDKWIDIPIPMGMMAIEDIEVPTDKGIVIVQKSKIAIRGSFIENPHYTVEDRANLMQACQDRPELYEAWVRGSWDAPYIDGALGAVWNRDVHIIDNFKIPPNWRLNRAFDWGYRAPFSVGWFAESDGEEFEDEKSGERRCYPRGTVIQFAEWYGSKKIGKNKGIGLTAREIARGIKTRETNFKVLGMIGGNARIYSGPADNQIDSVTGVGMDTIKSEMRAEGVDWRESDKSKGSRAIGLQAIVAGLRNSLTKEGAGLYFMRRCQAAIKILPSLNADGEDIAKDQEDHCYDMLRYRLVLKKRRDKNVRAIF